MQEVEEPAGHDDVEVEIVVDEAEAADPDPATERDDEERQPHA